MASLKQLEEEINKIKDRNRRVEAEKAWETSWTRKVLVAAFTYIVIGLFFSFAGVANPWINAIVPAIAFVLSTLSMPIFKNLWLKYICKK